ncbi:MAG: thioredoxin domain-containing protein [Acidobacteriota bacterium]|nr:thioredoxin domain-containing protein [Acidobacteriota bacterium]
MNRTRLWQFVLAVTVLVGSTLAWGGDTSMLRPPKGSKVAIIVFEDLECPDCARAAPLLHEAAKTYNIPLVQYDFPLPMHPWSFEAAVNARYFDTKSKQVGDDYRLYIFQNQLAITKQNLRGYTERFAEQHKTPLPFVVDPSGELAAKVKADYQLGQKIPLDHTPTIYVVSDSVRGTPFIEVVDRTQLYQLIEQVMKETGATAKPASASKTTKSH